MATLPNSNHGSASKRTGASLVQLSLVVVLMGAMGAFGVPRLQRGVEQSKADEAFCYLDDVRNAQERYRSRTGSYTTDFADLDMSRIAPAYFTVPPVIDADESTWSLQLTRVGARAGYGPYTISFNQDGYDTDTAASSIPSTLIRRQRSF